MKKWWSISALKAQISNIKTQEWEAKKKAWHDSGKLEGGNKGYIYKKQ
jgi:hypothetical protein